MRRGPIVRCFIAGALATLIYIHAYPAYADAIWQSAPDHSTEATPDSSILFGTWPLPDFTTDGTTTMQIWARSVLPQQGYFHFILEASSGGNPFFFTPATQPAYISSNINQGSGLNVLVFPQPGNAVQLIGMPANPGITIHHGDELWGILIPATSIIPGESLSDMALGGSTTTPELDVCHMGCAPIIPLQTATVTVPVIIIPGVAGSAQEDGVWVIDPIQHAFSNLIDTLDDNGYTEGNNLFTFGYDWHKSNVDTAILLKQEIDAVKNHCQCDKVDLVAHSMGGLVARQYIESPAYGHDVRNMIFIGTPHLGAPEDYLMWEGGQEVVRSLSDPIENRIFSNEAYKAGYRGGTDAQNTYNYIHGAPVQSIQELLPVYDYLQNSGAYTVSRLDYPLQYPRNLFLENLNANVSNLTNSGVLIKNYVGNLTTSSTISGLRVVPPPGGTLPLWADGYPEDFDNILTDRGLILGPGDGKVPLPSSSYINQNVTTLNANHGDLITAAEGDIFKTLTGKQASTLVTSENGVGIDSVGILMVEIFSPADFVVIAPDGKRVGKNFATGQELTEIPGSFYTGYKTDTEYVTIPNPEDGQYKIITQGTGNGGEYTLAASIDTLATSSETFFSGQTLPGLITEHDVNVNVEQPEQTTIIPADGIPPTIVFNQPATTTYTHADFLPINVGFTDSTGISTSSVTFDSRVVDASSTVDLFYETLGAHAIVASAADLVNNATTSVRNIQIIATLASTQSDITRAFTLGWITKKDVRDDLLNKLSKAVTIQTKIDTVVVSTNPRVVKTVTRLEQKFDTVLLKALSKNVEDAKNKGQLNLQGYSLITGDINWLLTN